MNDIIERNIRELRRRHGAWGIERLRQLLIEEENIWTIARELDLPKLVVIFARDNLPLFLRLVEPKKIEQKLTLVYSRRKTA